MALDLAFEHTDICVKQCTGYGHGSVSSGNSRASTAQKVWHNAHQAIVRLEESNGSRTFIVSLDMRAHGAPRAWLYSHNVGAVYQSNGTASIKKYIWNSSTTFAQDVANSNLFWNYALQVIAARIDEITSHFDLTNDDAQQFTGQNWDGGQTGVDFGLVDPDLWFSIGQAHLSNFAFTFTAEKKIVTDPEGNKYRQIQITNLSYSGTISDFYDFDLKATDFAHDGAVVQAGYGTITSSLGSGGQVFRTEIGLNNNAASEVSERDGIVLGSQPANP
ncbi:MAG TPA: hypothetical protein VHD56_11610 [Tepidisphaeraceae bacterium]|nr:hypothetical protein [Tepidisphaeraceae bacterium]